MDGVLPSQEVSSAASSAPLRVTRVFEEPNVWTADSQHHCEEKLSTKPTAAQSETLAGEANSDVSTSVEEPVDTHRRVRFASGKNEEESNEPPNTEVDDGPSLKWNNVILETLLAMSGMNQSTSSGAAPDDIPARLTGLLNENQNRILATAVATGPAAAVVTSSYTPPDLPLSVLEVHNTSFLTGPSLSTSAEQEEGNMASASHDQHEQLHTPAQRRVPDLYADASSSPNSEGVSVLHGPHSVSSGGGARAGPAGLVSTARTSPSADRASRSAASSESPSQPPVPHRSRAAKESNTAGADVERGPQWQRDFASHAQQVLRETHKQVEVLRAYQAKAARETQRADQLADAQRVLQSKLAAQEEMRLQAETVHKATVAELSRQVLQLDETVGALRRTKNDLESQLAAVRSSKVAQEKRHEAELEALARRHEQQTQALRNEHQQREAKWEQERESLLAQTVRKQTEDLRASATPAKAGDSPSVSRADAATTTTATSPDYIGSESGSSDPYHAHVHWSVETAPSEGPYERVHLDVLAQQQLREKTLMSQLSLLETRLQQEVQQRRQSEQRVTELLGQNEELREAAAAHAAVPALTASTLDTKKNDVAGRAHGTAAAATSNEAMSAQVHVYQQQQQQQQQQALLLHKTQMEYAALQRESAKLLQLHTAQQRRYTETWAAVHSRLLPLFAFAGLKPDALPHTADDDQSTLAALETLLATLQAQQQRTEALTSAQDREAARLATLRDALERAEAQSSDRCALLEVTEAQLQEARRELAVWRKRQHEIVRRQQQQEEAWRAAKLSVKRVMAILQRALHEYAEPLPRSEVEEEPAASTSKKRALSRRPTASTTVEKSVVGAVQLSDAEEGSAASTIEVSTVRCSADLSDSSIRSNSSSSSRTAEPPLTAREVPAEAKIPASSVDAAPTPLPGAEAVQEDGVGVSSLSGATPTSAVTTENGDGRARRGGRLTMEDLQHDVDSLGRDVMKLLAMWRSRQSRLLESQRRWRRKADESQRVHAASEREHDAQERRLTQQLHALHSTEQFRENELEALKRDWTATLAQQAAQHARELQCCREEAVAREQDRLAHQIRAAEEGLKQAHEEGDALRASVVQLQEAQDDAAKSQDQARRRQHDLNVHIEDLEERLRGAQQAEVGLRALLAAAASAVLQLLFTRHQLRQHCQAVQALRSGADYVAEVMERVLGAASGTCSRHRDGASQGPAPPSPTTLSLFAVSSVPSSPVRRMRVAAHAVVAVHRLRQRAKLQRSTPRGVASSYSPSFLPLSNVLASCGVWAVACLTPEEKKSGGCCGCGCGGGFLPTVRLPHTQELVTPVLAFAAETAAGQTRDVDALTGARLGVSEDARESEADGEVSAKNGGPRTTVDVLLLHLLSVAQVEVHSPSMRRTLADVRTSTAVGQLFQYHRQQAQLQRSTLYALLKRDEVDVSPMLPRLLSFLPLKLSAPLEQLLSRSALASRQLTEVQGVVQKLVGQNERLVAAVESQARLDETRTLEIDSLTEQLSWQAPRQNELISLQERVVQSHASLLAERRRRREAEHELAHVRQAQLQSAAEAEHLKREVYALNMELANAANTAVTACEPSVLSIQQDADTSVGEGEAAGQAEAAAQQQQQQPQQHMTQAPRSCGAADQKRNGRTEEEGVYYRRLLRGLRDGVINAATGKAEFHYEERHNIPLADALTQAGLQGSPSHGRSAAVDTSATVVATPYTGVVTEARNTSALKLFVPKVVQEQQQQQRRAGTGSKHGIETATQGEYVSRQEPCLSCSQGRHFDEAEPTAPAAPAAAGRGVRIVISPSEKRHRTTRDLPSPGHYSTRVDDSTSSTIQGHHHHNMTSPPSIRTGATLSTAPSARVQQQLSVFTAAAVSASGATPPTTQVQNERKDALPQRLDQQEVWKSRGTREGKPGAATFAKAWSPSPSFAAMSAMQSNSPAQHYSHDVEEEEVEEARAKAKGPVVSRDSSERSATQRPPAVRLSMSAPLPSPLSSATASMPASLPSSLHRVEVADTRGSLVSPVSSGPLYVTPRT